MKFPDWVIADTHFGHANINAYCQRLTPAFPEPHMVESLMLDNWYELVEPEHTILHLGDVAFRGYDMKFLEALPGQKFWLRGNHDKHIKEISGWTEIEAPEFEVEGGRVLFTHYPQKLHGQQAHQKLVNIHGHVHNNPYESTPFHINASIECWHYAPISGSVLRNKAEWALKSSKVSNADYGPRTVKYRGR